MFILTKKSTTTEVKKKNNQSYHTFTLNITSEIDMAFHTE